MAGRGRGGGGEGVIVHRFGFGSSPALKLLP
jgi:hypothetical protein